MPLSRSFALDDATDLKEAYGLLEGNVVMVDYKAAGEGEMPVATKVACSRITPMPSAAG